MADKKRQMSEEKKNCLSTSCDEIICISFVMILDLRILCLAIYTIVSSITD